MALPTPQNLNGKYANEAAALKAIHDYNSRNQATDLTAKVSSKVHDILAAELAVGNATIDSGISPSLQDKVDALIPIKNNIVNLDSEISQAQNMLIQIDNRIERENSVSGVVDIDNDLANLKNTKTDIISLNGWMILALIYVENNLLNAKNSILTTEAEKLVAQAETGKTQAEHTAAEAVVRTITDAGVKSSFESRLAAVQDTIDEGARQVQAETLVTQAETGKTQAEHAAAEAVVRTITDAGVRSSFESRLAAVQSGINTARDLAVSDIEIPPAGTSDIIFTPRQKINIPYSVGVPGIKIKIDRFEQIISSPTGNITLPANSLGLGHHEIDVELEDPVNPANNRTIPVPVNIITDANHTSYVSDLTQTEITAGDSINMNVQIPRDTTMVIEYETGGRWIPHKRVPASTSRFDSQSVALNPPFAKTPGNYKFRTFLVDKNTGIILPHGILPATIPEQTLEIKPKEFNDRDMGSIIIPENITLTQGVTGPYQIPVSGPIGAKIECKKSGGTVITVTPSHLGTTSTDIEIADADIDTTDTGEDQFITVKISDPVYPARFISKQVKVIVKAKKMSLRSITPDFGTSALTPINPGDTLTLPALDTPDITGALALITGPGIPADTKVLISTTDTIEIPGLDTSKSGNIRVTLIDPNNPSEKSHPKTLSFTVNKHYPRPNLSMGEWTLGSSSKPELKIELLKPNSTIRITYPDTVTGGVYTKDIPTGTGGALSETLAHLNPATKDDNQIRVEYLDGTNTPIPGTEKIFYAIFKPKAALTRPEGLPAQVALAGHDQKITLKLKPGQTAILDDGHGHFVAGLPTGQPDEYSFCIPYAHPHRHSYQNTPSTYNIRISDAAGTVLTPDFPVRVTDEIPPTKGTLAHGALDSIKNSTTSSGTLDIYDYRSPHDGSRLAPGCITWNKSSTLKLFTKYTATIDGPHGTINVKAAKTPEELINNIKHDIDHLYEHEMLEYCNVFNKPVPEALKSNDHETHEGGAKPGKEEKEHSAHGGEKHSSDKGKKATKFILKWGSIGLAGSAVTTGLVGAASSGLGIVTGGLLSPIGLVGAGLGVGAWFAGKHIYKIGKKKQWWGSDGGGDSHSSHGAH